MVANGTTITYWPIPGEAGYIFLKIKTAPEKCPGSIYNLETDWSEWHCDDETSCGLHGTNWRWIWMPFSNSSRIENILEKGTVCGQKLSCPTEPFCADGYMNAPIDIAAIVTKIVEKARLQEQWTARLQILKTCGDRVQADFDKFVFYFDLTHKMRGNNFTSTDARYMIKIVQKILTTLDDDLAVVEKEIVDLALLHQRTGQQIVRENLSEPYYDEEAGETRIWSWMAGSGGFWWVLTKLLMPRGDPRRPALLSR
ncbi:unnamed protein product [Caenorhabditis auriculariae]|uniref:Uncharacterized protein n=1 Tax=Caenorhabditis auriculariae TaxID=2777116 RepID=A0A8S1HZ61_9PELO|nr:unnamed protein product [Caenorhabditis auriculariae]